MPIVFLVCVLNQQTPLLHPKKKNKYGKPEENNYYFFRLKTQSYSSKLGWLHHQSLLKSKFAIKRLDCLFATLLKIRR